MTSSACFLTIAVFLVTSFLVTFLASGFTVSCNVKVVPNVILAHLAELIKWAGQMLSMWICGYVWMLNRVKQIITAAHGDLSSCMHRPINELWSETKNQINMTYFIVFLGHRRKNYLFKLQTYGHQICAAGASDVDAPTYRFTPSLTYFPWYRRLKCKNQKVLGNYDGRSHNPCT